MLACQALITDRRWSALFWGLSFSIQISMFFFFSLFALGVLFHPRFFLQFYFRFGCSAQFVNKDRLPWSRLSQQSFNKRCSFFSFWRLAILGNMKESYRGIWRMAFWFGLAFHLSWIVPLNFLKEQYCFGMQKVQVLGFTWCEGSQA